MENSKLARIKIDKLTRFIKILSVSENEILEAIKSKFKDFEDSIQNACATNSKRNIIVTRNIKDLKHSQLQTMAEFLIKQTKG